LPPPKNIRNYKYLLYTRQSDAQRENRPVTEKKKKVYELQIPIPNCLALNSIVSTILTARIYIQITTFNSSLQNLFITP